MFPELKFSDFLPPRALFAHVRHEGLVHRRHRGSGEHAARRSGVHAHQGRQSNSALRPGLCFVFHGFHECIR